ncbi:MAG: hypothetical protein LCH82_17150 [Actinobacteria bacterium]|nr:hypothetical protein [Actinomycetota bacterium]
MRKYQLTPSDDLFWWADPRIEYRYTGRIEFRSKDGQWKSIDPRWLDTNDQRLAQRARTLIREYLAEKAQSERHGRKIAAGKLRKQIRDLERKLAELDEPTDAERRWTNIERRRHRRSPVAQAGRGRSAKPSSTSASQSTG